MTPQPIDWLWRGWLARGKFHLLAGAPGTGKTTIAIALAAAVTARNPWPSGYRSKAAGNVLFFVVWTVMLTVSAASTIFLVMSISALEGVASPLG